MFYFDFINGKKVLKSDKLKSAEHLFTTRETIIKSKESDMQSLVEKNRQLISEYLSVNELIYPSQTHSANVKFAKVGVTIYPETDALILDNFEQGIFLNFADCTPIILYDNKRNIGAISHAGWRGTVQKIAPKTIIEMGSKPEDITAIIGPAIGMCCSEVGEDVFNQLKSTVNNLGGLYDGNKVDLKGINARQLEEIGVEDIDICPYCTSCNNDLFFSYRKENGTTNRHSAVLRLKNQ